MRLTDRRIGVAVVYHGIGDPPGDPDRELVPQLSTRLFRSQIRHLQACYRLVTASELPDAARQRRRGQRIPIAITFDDDLASHSRVAAPILLEREAPATFFLTGASLYGPARFWWEGLQAAVDGGVLDESLFEGLSPESRSHGPHSSDIHELALSIQLAEPEERLKIERRLDLVVPDTDQTTGLRGGEVRSLADAGFEIGFHTLRHHYLPALSDEALALATNEGRDELAEFAGAELRAIAYPHGGGGARVAEAAGAAGFRVGYTTAPEALGPETDPLLIGRLEESFSSTGALAIRIAARLVGLR
jgi:peptidoglycan/xylan/chitin deacetylase (PgdA/CDA1 family)